MLAYRFLCSAMGFRSNLNDHVIQSGSQGSPEEDVPYLSFSSTLSMNTPMLPGLLSLVHCTVIFPDIDKNHLKIIFDHKSISVHPHFATSTSFLIDSTTFFNLKWYHKDFSASRYLGHEQRERKDQGSVEQSDPRSTTKPTAMANGLARVRSTTTCHQVSQVHRGCHYLLEQRESKTVV